MMLRRALLAGRSLRGRQLLRPTETEKTFLAVCSPQRTVFSSILDKVKGVFSESSTPASPNLSHPSPEFTLSTFADNIKTARGYRARLGGFLPNSVFDSLALDRQEAVCRALARHDPTGKNLDVKKKAEVAKECSCTVTDVENVLGKFEWMKQAAARMEKLQKEGKPLPKTPAEMQAFLGPPPLPPSLSPSPKAAESSVGPEKGQVSRNSLCPCGSKKKYKRCCGKT